MTVWNTAPPVMVALLESLRADGAALARFAALPLRLVMLSGDFCPLWVPTELRRLLGSQVRVFTLGGATEASIWSCWYEVGEVQPDWRSIPYGGPLANQQLYVLDPALQLTPKLVPGEICIGGVGLAEEYWRDAAKTEVNPNPNPNPHPHPNPNPHPHPNPDLLREGCLRPQAAALQAWGPLQGGTTGPSPYP